MKRHELKRVVKGQVRYQAIPFEVLIPQLLRRHPSRLPVSEREALDWAVLAYQDAPTNAGKYRLVYGLLRNEVHALKHHQLG